MHICAEYACNCIVCVDGDCRGGGKYGWAIPTCESFGLTSSLGLKTSNMFLYDFFVGHAVSISQ